MIEQQQLDSLQGVNACGLVVDIEDRVVYATYHSWMCMLKQAKSVSWMGFMMASSCGLNYML
jgi:hypothetical protein